MKARIGAGFMIWLAAVVSVAGIAWLAIGTAGKQVTAAPIAAPLPTEFPPTPSPTRTSVPVKSTTGDDGSRAPATADPTRRRTTAPVARTSPATSGAPDRRQRPRPRFTPVTSTYSTPAGRLRVRCEGQQITLDGGYAQPAPGWAVSVQSGGPDKIQVTFDTGKSAPVTVVAYCGEGKPRFSEIAAPRAVPTTTGGFRFRAQQSPTPPVTSGPATPASPTSPVCTVPASPSVGVTVAPTTAAPTTDPTGTVAPETTPPACPPVAVTATMDPGPTPDQQQGWGQDWTQREWAQRSRH